MNKFIGVGTFAVVMALVGCGGGGGVSTAMTTTSIGKAEGVYRGPATNGATTVDFSSLVLEDDSFWGITRLTGSSNVVALTVGSGISNNGTYSAAVRGYTNTGAVLDSTIKATYSPGVSISGTFSTGTSFNATTASSAGYIYDTPAQLSSLVGTWAGITMAGNALNLTVASNGNYSGISGSCAINGTMTPRPSGKNIFNVTYANAIAGCPLPNLTAQGISLVSPPSNGGTTLVMMFTASDKALGAVATLTKQ